MGRRTRQQGKCFVFALPTARVVKTGTIFANDHRLRKKASKVEHFTADA